jgi:transcriptional regulator with XRE-family HTH domain
VTVRDAHAIGVQKEIGRRIHRARLAAGMTQEAAAAAAGIDHKRWQRLEQGGVNPTARTLVRVATALGLTFWALLALPAPPSDAPTAPVREAKGSTQRRK